MSGNPFRPIDPSLPRDYVALVLCDRKPVTVEHSMFKSHREEMA